VDHQPIVREDRRAETSRHSEMHGIGGPEPGRSHHAGGVFQQGCSADHGGSDARSECSPVGDDRLLERPGTLELAGPALASPVASVLAPYIPRECGLKQFDFQQLAPD
jgi:hypothetical protein